jgi:hypothetical protein
MFMSSIKYMAWCIKYVLKTVLIFYVFESLQALECPEGPYSLLHGCSQTHRPIALPHHDVPVQCVPAAFIETESALAPCNLILVWYAIKIVIVTNSS